ncbi:MAG: 3-oxoadipate enol-lactonase / 4-carboxymuconolactone decarboxylase [Acidobacteriaceae bacterium]|jgi:3-oxoadipate enol-lactonase|nr:3-oxoadipate enol-lactonase / 4-carboxymuconolactone decarboxylase [Acidobacteriaceae bacterium]
MPQIDSGDVSLYYELSGPAGTRVLMLSNSLGTTLDMWEPQMRAFEKHFQVLRYDMRGHGRSSTGTKPCTIQLLGHDVIALLDALELRSIQFCGLSIGGAIGQWLGIHAPERLSKLLLCNSAARIGNPQSWSERIQTIQAHGMQPIVEAGLRRWFTQDFLVSGAPMIEKMRTMLADSDPAGYIACCEALREMDLRDAVQAIAVPVCILAGESDRVTTVEDAREIEQKIRGSQVVVLPAAHISNVEVPDLFEAAALAFLETG